MSVLDVSHNDNKQTTSEGICKRLDIKHPLGIFTPVVGLNLDQSTTTRSQLNTKSHKMVVKLQTRANMMGRECVTRIYRGFIRFAKYSPSCH